MRHLIDIISKPALTEGRNEYKAMVEPLLSAIMVDPSDLRKDDPAVNLGERARDDIEKMWADHMAESRQILKRDDRVIWYLRLIRQALIAKHSKLLDPTKVAKLTRDYASKTGSMFDPNEDSNRGLLNGRILTNLEHFFSLPIPAIQNYQFAYQSPTEVIAEFTAIDKEWQETLDRMFIDNECEVVIDFENGWFWVNAHKASCS